VEKCGAARQATDDSIIRRMRLACLKPLATRAHRICNTCWFSMATMVMRTRPNVRLQVRYFNVTLCEEEGINT